MKTSIIKKTLALLLAALTVISCVPVSALIANTGEPVETIVKTEQQATVPSDKNSTPDEVEYEAVSGTYNIVGQVLANAFNSVGEEPEKRAAALGAYPTEKHEPSYYEGTHRLRYLADGGDEPNYLVYRDTFLIIPEDEGANYTIEYSEDGHTAFITPAIPEEALDGKTGVVFLRENIGLDEILVFDDEPAIGGGTLTVTLKNTDDIVITELFSDGKLEYDGNAANVPDQRVGVQFETNPSGTNWEGEITGFDPSWPTAHVHVDVWELEFQLILNLRFDLDFEIETTGDSGGRESVTIAGVSVPVELFTINVRYDLQVEFHDTPLEMKGTLTTDMDITFDILFGTRVSRYRNPVSFSELRPKDEYGYNRNLSFYIGSELLIQGGFLELSIDLWLFSVHIGPVLSLNLSNYGGCYVTFRYEKDTFEESDIGSRFEIHTCAKTGEEGCVDVHIREISRSRIYFKVDLYFDDWTFNLNDSDEKTVSEGNYYISYTYNSGWQEGYCPHRLYKVPVAVWADEAMTQPVGSANVTVLDPVYLSEQERQYYNGVTGSDGRTSLYLPYSEDFRYTVVASKQIGEIFVAGQTQQTDPINNYGNSTVNVILKQDSETKLHIRHIWNIDCDDKDRPETVSVLIQRRTDPNAGWTTADTITLNQWSYWIADYTGEKFDVAAGLIYEYRAVVSDAIPDEGSPTTFVTRDIKAYTTIGTEAEPDHYTRYYVEYSTVPTDNGLNVTVTETAMVSITLNKRWNIADEEARAVPVYLVLEQKPAEGWGEKAKERSVPGDWVPVIRPFSGDTTSIRELVDKGILTVESIPAVENAPLSIGEVSKDNGWKTTFMVPKYRDGVKMQFMGGELSAVSIQDLLKNEFDVNVIASVAPFGDFESEPGHAFREAYDGWKFFVDILNHDSDEHTIGGTVRWVYYWAEEKFSVRIRVFDKNGNEVEGSPVYLDKDADPTDCWTWSLTGDSIDPNEEYTITEEFDGYARDYYWIPFIDGLNVINYGRRGSQASLRIKAIFENATEDDELPDAIPATVTDGTRVSTQNLYKTWDYAVSWSPAMREPLTVTVPEYEGWVAEYKPAEYTFYSGTSRIYYLIIYRRQMPVQITLEKECDLNGDASAPELSSVIFDVFRNGELIATRTLTRSGLYWSTVYLYEDDDGNSLMRLAPDGSRYDYTVVERPIAGWTSSVDSQFTDYYGTNRVYITVKNKWVGADHVKVSGTVSWEGDEGHEDFRPESVQISVINSRDEYVTTLTVPVVNGRFEANYLPSTDANGEALSYAVLESHVRGYTSIYAKPTFDENTRTWTCNVTNKLTGYTTINIKKVVEGEPANENEAYCFHIEPNTDADNGEHEFPEPLNANITINGAGEKKAEFIIDENGLYLYSVKEVKGSAEGCVYDETERLVLIVRTTDSDGNVRFRSWVGKAGDNIAPTDETVSDTVTFTNVYPSITVEKKWDIDLEGKDRPSSIEVIVQKKNGSDWENVKLIELNEDNDWKKSVWFEGMDDAEVRVRELREETALQEIINYISQWLPQPSEGNYIVFWLPLIKEQLGSYYDALPEYIRSAADEGLPQLMEVLNSDVSNTFDKLMEQIKLATVSNRIVYDEDDSDRSGKTNEVTYHVDEYTSVLSGGTEDAHVTKYKVSYKKDGSTYTITNMAILEIDVIKRWIGIGVDDDDMPDSAWVVLMCKPKADALENASDLASGLGVDLGGVLDYEFPVINPEEGGKDALTLLSEVTIGLDISMIGKLAEKLFGLKIPELAVAKVDEDCDWKAEFVISKYNFGIPMEYKGAELWSEVIRQIIKYLIGFSLPVSFNPFDGYFSIPTKAIPTILGIEDPSDILDFSGLAGKALEKAMSLTMDDISNFGWNTMLDDYHLMANVINVKIDWDSEDDDTLHGSKVWVGDDESKRPDYILIHVKDGDEEIEGSPIRLNKSDFSGSSEWTWSIDKPDDASAFAVYVVSEEYPAGYAYKDDYTCEIDGLDITNTWHKDNFTISGTKIWQDDGDAYGIRPETVTIRLLADGVEVASAVTSQAGNWKYFFPNQPKKKDGRTIEYTVSEDPVPGYIAKTDGYNIINTAASDLRITVSRSEADAAREQSFIFTMQGPNGGGALSLQVMIVLAAGETSGSALIKAMPTGEYTVTESSGWSWRYSGESSKTVTVEPGNTAVASFTLSIVNEYWLDACGSEDTGTSNASTGTQTAAILPGADEDKKRYGQNA